MPGRVMAAITSSGVATARPVVPLTEVECETARRGDRVHCESTSEFAARCQCVAHVLDLAAGTDHTVERVAADDDDEMTSEKGLLRLAVGHAGIHRHGGLLRAPALHPL